MLLCPAGAQSCRGPGVPREQKDGDTPMHWLAPFSVALVAVLSALQSETRAQDYPTRPVTVVAPYAAGGGADLVARVLAQKLGDRLGQSFVVENRLGAGGVIAASSVAKASPDGYTVFLGTSTQLAI